MESLMLLPVPRTVRIEKSRWRPRGRPEPLITAQAWRRPLQQTAMELADNTKSPVRIEKDNRLPNQGYALRLDNTGVWIRARDAAGAFYGCQTLCQLLAGEQPLPQLEIEDWPTIPLRGIMFDVARDRLLTLPELKRLVDFLALTKQNLFGLYMEDTFVFARHPSIGNDGARMTPDEVRELDAYCRERFVTLVPSLATFGHMRNILRLAPYETLADNHFLWSIAPGRPESYRFLGELLEEFLPCFSAPYFHMNADETWDIKEARDSHSCARIKKFGFARVYLNHVVRVGRMAEKYGKRPILWADMLQKYQDTFARLPREFIPNFWGYEDKEEFIAAPMATRHGLSAWISPSVSSHNALFCRLDNAKLNIHEAARIAAGNGLAAMMNTVWWGGWRAILGRRQAHGPMLYAEYKAFFRKQQMGSLSLLAGVWHGIAYSGECAWCLPPRSDPSFERRLVHLFYGQDVPELATAWRLIGGCYKKAGIDGFDNSNQPTLYKEMPSKARMCFESTPENLRAMREDAAEAGRLWRRCGLTGGRDPILGCEFLLASDLTCWTADKALLTLEGDAARLKWKKLLARHVGLIERYLAGLRARCPEVIARLAEERLRQFHGDLKKDRG